MENDFLLIKILSQTLSSIYQHTTFLFWYLISDLIFDKKSFILQSVVLWPWSDWPQIQSRHLSSQALPTNLVSLWYLIPNSLSFENRFSTVVSCKLDLDRSYPQIKSNLHMVYLHTKIYFDTSFLPKVIFWNPNLTPASQF